MTQQQSPPTGSETLAEGIKALLVQYAPRGSKSIAPKAIPLLFDTLRQFIVTSGVRNLRLTYRRSHFSFEVLPETSSFPSKQAFQWLLSAVELDLKDVDVPSDWPAGPAGAKNANGIVKVLLMSTTKRLRDFGDEHFPNKLKAWQALAGDGYYDHNDDKPWFQVLMVQAILSQYDVMREEYSTHLSAAELDDKRATIERHIKWLKDHVASYERRLAAPLRHWTAEDVDELKQDMRKDIAEIEDMQQRIRKVFAL